MTKPYKELDLSELKLERARLQHILNNHPLPKTYRCTKASLERVNKLIAEKLSRLLVNSNI